MLRGITVGLGFFGGIHLEGWSRVGKAEIIAVVDRNEEKAGKVAARYDVRPYVDLASAIERGEHRCLQRMSCAVSEADGADLEGVG
ncbi:Gfo/Idh/MocA family oxidoreductase [Candidatus Poribacteria bacterium]|nr:Gfo/Idh/MocA family oxidoreductase [Candidatus Poribacteria bacterium]